MISIIRAEQAFAAYVRNYNPSDGKIRLKIVHTYHVAETAESIAESLHLSKEDTDLAKLIGILHDVGRFEQIRRYGDFRDYLTVNHAELGADLLEAGLLREFIEDPSYDDIILKAIRMHNRFAIDEDLDERTLLHCRLIRDADKTDIFRVRVEDPITDVQAFDQEAIENSDITPSAFEAFMQHVCLNREKVRTPADSWIAGAAMIFDYNFLPGLAILSREHRIDQMIGRFTYRKPDTAEKMDQVRQCANRYIESRLQENRSS